MQKSKFYVCFEVHVPVIFPTFFHYFSFSHKLIENFMTVVCHSLVIMHPNIHSRPQLPTTGCFGCTEVHLFQFQRVGRGQMRLNRKYCASLKSDFL